jgi:hypothetical protein
MKMVLYKVMFFLALAMCIFYCSGCRKISESDLVGKWVYELDLPEEKTGLNNVKKVTIEFFADKTFKMTDMPAVIWGVGLDIKDTGKGKVITGHGTWFIRKHDSSKRVSLFFSEIEGVGSCKSGVDALSITWQPFGRITLLTEYRGSHLCFFYKVKD